MSRGGGHRDGIATAMAGFVDSRSYVRLDGKRFLFGDDMEQLRRKVFERDGWSCTGDVGGERCMRRVTWDGYYNKAQMHHVKTRGKGGDDSLSNCVTLCPGCHRREHVRVKLRWMRETA